MSFYTSIFSKLARHTRAAKIKPVKVEFAKTPILKDKISLLEMDRKTLKKYINGKSNTR